MKQPFIDPRIQKILGDVDIAIISTIECRGVRVRMDVEYDPFFGNDGAVVLRLQYSRAALASGPRFKRVERMATQRFFEYPGARVKWIIGAYLSLEEFRMRQDIANSMEVKL